MPYPRCKAEAAWDENDNQRFAKCTEEISQAHPWLFNAMPNIKKFSAINHNATTPIEIQIEEALEGVFKDPYGSNGLKTALAFIKTQAELFESFTSCSQIIGCQETARKTILKLVMTEWGIYGLGKDVLRDGRRSLIW